MSIYLMGIVKTINITNRPHCQPWSQTAHETWIAALNVITKIFLNSESYPRCWNWLKSQLLDSVQVGGVGQTFDSAKDKE